MDAIVLEQFGTLIDRLQPERDQVRPVFLRQIAIERVEIALEFRPVIGRRAHPHQQHRNAAIPQFAEHRFEIGARFCWRNAAQQIVAAQFENDEVDILLLVEHEWEALAPRPAGVARYARIDDPCVDPACAQGRFELGRIAVFRPDTVSRKQAVPESEDAAFRPADGDLRRVVIRRDGRGFARLGRGIGALPARSESYQQRNDRQTDELHRRGSLWGTTPCAIAVK